jgi:hypothetical protein
MPMVLIKAFEMKSRSFTDFRCSFAAMVSGIVGHLTESDWASGASYWNKGLPQWW